MKFYKSVIQTMKDTTWPDRKKAALGIKAVVVTSILFTIFFAIVDYVVQEILQLFV
ncbi:preprotein translocase subunit SecE [Liquorilactobacillus sicerae]|uniref:preprotein translocase subunit SecE n=1 Tax=Liquorilactobacillus sicerae TaxID=1416943 RepID=UPI002480FCB6|nr:preprotein translocase subunit SecE [Liquorilactobacillus sicerae]